MCYKTKCLGKEMVDYIADYLENIRYIQNNISKRLCNFVLTFRERRVFPEVKPGYLRDLVPDKAPDMGEDWDSIFADVERCEMINYYIFALFYLLLRCIMPGVTHWQSPYMHAYFPALNSYPSLLGDMLADGINCLGFTWVSH